MSFSISNFGILEVELLVVRAISLNLVKGVIDEVDEKVHMTWVQPRVLNTEQVIILQFGIIKAGVTDGIETSIYGS